MGTSIHYKIKMFSLDGDMLNFKIGNERKMRQKDLSKEDLLFICEEVPFKADCDTNKFAGNCRLNLIGDTEQIKRWIIEENINTLFDKSKAMLCIEAKEEFGHNEYMPLFMTKLDKELLGYQTAEQKEKAIILKEIESQEVAQ